MTTSKPETFVLRIDLEQFVFDQTKEEFESTIDLHWPIYQRDLREALIAKYDEKQASK